MYPLNQINNNSTTFNQGEKKIILIKLNCLNANIQIFNTYLVTF